MTLDDAAEFFVGAADTMKRLGCVEKWEASAEKLAIGEIAGSVCPLCQAFKVLSGTKRKKLFVVEWDGYGMTDCFRRRTLIASVKRSSESGSD